MIEVTILGRFKTITPLLDVVHGGAIMKIPVHKQRKILYSFRAVGRVDSTIRRHRSCRDFYYLFICLFLFPFNQDVLMKFCPPQARTTPL